jgi:hypothetical protein
MASSTTTNRSVNASERRHDTSENSSDRQASGTELKKQKLKQLGGEDAGYLLS